MTGETRPAPGVPLPPGYQPDADTIHMAVESFTIMRGPLAGYTGVGGAEIPPGIALDTIAAYPERFAIHPKDAERRRQEETLALLRGLAQPNGEPEMAATPIEPVRASPGAPSWDRETFLARLAEAESKTRPPLTTTRVAANFLGLHDEDVTPDHLGKLKRRFLEAG